MIRAFFQSIQKTLFVFPLILLVYLVNLGLGLLLALPYFKVFRGGIGNSMEPSKLLAGYDHTVYRDLMEQIEGSIAVVDGQTPWMILIFVLLSIFFNGGIIGAMAASQDISRKSFWINCRHYFGRFFRLSIISIIAYGILAVIIALPLAAYFKGISSSFTSEQAFVIPAIIGAGIFLFLFSFLSMSNDYAKVKIVAENSRSALRMFFSGLKFSFRHFFSAYIFYVLLAMILLVGGFTYWKLSGVVGTSSMFTIILLFIIQQILVFIRTSIRIWHLAYASSLYQNLQRGGRW